MSGVYKGDIKIISDDKGNTWTIYRLNDNTFFKKKKKKKDN